MRADHAVLVCGGRSPVGRSLGDHEAVHGDIADAGLLRHEALLAHVDFHVLVVRICAEKVHVEYGAPVLLLGEPFAAGLLRLPRALVDLTCETLLHGGCLIEHPVVPVDDARVFRAPCEIPVSVDIRGVRIGACEDGIVHAGSPDRPLIQGPVLQDLRACDHGAERLGAGVRDAGVLCPGMSRADVLAVRSGRYENLIPRLCNPGCLLNAAEWPVLGSVTVVTGVGIYIKLHE